MGIPPADKRCLVKVEAKRIQTFIFSVPRLKEMIGANALLGDFVRRLLVDFVSNQGVPVPCPEGVSSAFPGDPLPSEEDNPAANFGRGILSREGGHFNVLFPDRKVAESFATKARNAAAKTLPGLRVDIRFKTIQAPESNRDECGEKEDHDEEAPVAFSQIVDLPHFQVCQASGDGPAAELDKRTINDRVQLHISDASAKKLAAGNRLQDRDTETGYKDILSVLRHRLPCGALDDPKDLSELADSGGYLAVIHADGNRVGARVKRIKESAPAGTLEQEAEVERFFHHMRSAVRASLIEALKAVFDEKVLKDLWRQGDRLPYQILMLGGDDLLLVCRPRFALPFIEHYARQLASKTLCDDKPLSIGAGIAIASHKLPFHRLHALAEDLATSAKLTYLQKPNGCEKPPERSVVDWTVITASSMRSLADHRRTADFRAQESGKQRKCMALTSKPYFVLDGDDLPPGTVSLASLLGAAKELDYAAQNHPPPRSQLKDMYMAMGEGHLTAWLRYRELLRRYAKLGDVLLPFSEAYRDDPWIDAGEARYLTHLRDLIEVMELDYLGRRKPGVAPVEEDQGHVE